MLYEKTKFFWNNRPMNRSLFLEYSDTIDSVLFTLEKQHEQYVCLKDEYVKYCSVDPSEFTFATETFPSWEYWIQVAESRDIAPFVEKWREENVIRWKSKALSEIIKEASSGKNKYQAAKWLYENNYISNKKINRKNKTSDTVRKEILDDAQRVLKVVS